jgi:hypothetical protein
MKEEKRRERKIRRKLVEIKLAEPEIQLTTNQQQAVDLCLFHQPNC